MTAFRWILLGAAIFCLMALGLHRSDAGRQKAFLGGAEYPYVESDPGCGCGVGQ